MAAKTVRQIRIDGNLAYVPLTKGYEAVIDAADVHLVNMWNWRVEIKGSTIYATRNQRFEGKMIGVRMHRHIMGYPPGLEIDHKNGDGLDNRRSVNLRTATTSQNQHNQKIRIDNASGLKGVNWENRRSKWRAQIKLNRKMHHLGYFETPEQAHAAYCDASARLHSEFGRTS